MSCIYFSNHFIFSFLLLSLVFIGHTITLSFMLWNVYTEKLWNWKVSSTNTPPCIACPPFGILIPWSVPGSSWVFCWCYWLKIPPNPLTFQTQIVDTFLSNWISCIHSMTKSFVSILWNPVIFLSSWILSFSFILFHNNINLACAFSSTYK